MNFLFNNSCIKPIECTTVASDFSITDDNELTVNWNISIGWYNLSIVNLYCSNKSIDIILTELECTTGECDERISVVLIKNKSYTFSKKLKACAKYSYLILEKPSGEVNPVIEISLVAKEQFQKIDFEVFQDRNEVESINISWPYESYPLCPKKFKIEVRENSLLFKSSETSKNINVTIEAVQPCSTYEISVVSLSADEVPQKEFGDTKSYNTLVAIPAGIKNLKLEYNDDKSIDASWETPNYAKCVKSYIIEAESSVDNRSESTTRNNIVFVNVFACIVYRIRVTPVLRFTEIAGNPADGDIRVPSRGWLRKLKLI